LRRLRLTAFAVALASAGAGILLAVPAVAKAPKKPGKVRVDRVSPTGIKLRWKDRAKNETGYEVRRRQVGHSRWKAKRVRRNRTRFKNGGLDPGTVHEHQVRACNRNRCSGWSPLRRQATLLAPFGDPYPDLGSCGVFPPSSAPPNAPSATTPAHGTRTSPPLRCTRAPTRSSRASVRTGPTICTHHVLVVHRDKCELFEFYGGEYRGGTRNRWQADSTARFDLASTAPRPDTYNAIRVTFNETRQAFIHPATHYASSSCEPDRPAMGMRLRLKAGYDISALDGQAQVIAVALKRYGMIVARQRLQLVHHRRNRQPLERRRPQPPQGHPRLGVRGRALRGARDHSVLSAPSSSSRNCFTSIPPPYPPSSPPVRTTR
jgi:hypothetical protein